MTDSKPRLGELMSFPAHGQSPDLLLASLQDKKAHDVPWQQGRVFAYIYDAGDEAMSLVRDAFSLYLVENGLDPTSFPSAMELEKEVIAMALDLVGGGSDACGTFTCGGTESLLLSVKTARDYFRQNRPQISRPELVLAETAHSSFFKACQYFDIRPVTVPVDDRTFQVVPAAMEAAITPNTIMMVGSTPSYAHGVIDPIEALGQIALRHDILLHVDACVGGMYLPFARSLGYDIPPFDLSVPGVTQLSMDFHKWGYAAKGASCILYNRPELRRHQIFACSSWIGYTVVNPGVVSTKGAGPVAACWAILKHLGRDGYERLVDRTQAASLAIRKGIAGIDGIEVVGKPETNLFSFRATDFNIFPVADEMRARGWYIQPQFGFSNSPENIHLSVGNSNVPHVSEFIKDLAETVGQVRARDQACESVPPELGDLQLTGTGDGAAILDRVGQSLPELAGRGEGQLPQRMDNINLLLNAMPARLREEVLAEYIHRLYR